MFPKEDATNDVSDNAQKDLPSDGKYEGFADVNDVIITDLKNLLSTEGSKGTAYNVVSLDIIPTILFLIIRMPALMQGLKYKKLLVTSRFANKSLRQQPVHQCMKSNVSSPAPLNYGIQRYFCPYMHINYSSFFYPLQSQTNY